MGVSVVVHTGANTTRVDAEVAVALSAAGGTTLRVDASQPVDVERLLDAVCQQDLFGTVHVVKVDHVEKLPVTAAERIAAAPTEATIVGKSHGTFTKKLERAFGNTVSVTKHNAPKGKTLSTEIRLLASDAGINLSQPAASALEGRCADDLLRARSICNQLAAAGFTDPTPAQVEVLAGSTAAAPAPWDVTDALEAGRIADMFELAAACAPVPTAVYVADHVLALARIAENSWNADAACEGLAVHRFRASKLAAAARRFGPERTREAAVAATGLDRASKSSDPTAKVALVLAQVAAALHG